MEFVKKQARLAWNFYREYLGPTHRWCMAAFLLVCVLSAALFGLFADQAAAVVEGLVESFMDSVQMGGILEEDGSISLPALLGHNLQATLMAAAMGLVPFVFLPVLSLALNGLVVGAALALSGFAGVPVWRMVLLGLLPHGIFEIPAIMLGVAMGIYLCRQMNGALRKRPGTPRLEAILPHLARVTVFGVVPLLTVAAVIETVVTPLLLALL